MSARTIITMLCAVLCFALSAQDKIITNVNAQLVQQLREQAVICEKETGVPAAVFKKILDDWPLDNNEPTKKFFHCVCFNCKYSDEDGHLIIENMAVLTVKNGTREEYLDRLRECNKITLENHLDTLFAIGDCVHDKIMFTVD